MFKMSKKHIWHALNKQYRCTSKYKLRHLLNRQSLRTKHPNYHSNNNQWKFLLNCLWATLYWSMWNNKDFIWLDNASHTVWVVWKGLKWNVMNMFLFIFPSQNGVELKPGKDLRIYAMGRKRFLQIMKCQVSDSGMYTCDAGDVTTSCTVEVYGKVCCLNTINYKQVL